MRHFAHDEGLPGRPHMPLDRGRLPRARRDELSDRPDPTEPLDEPRTQRTSSGLSACASPQPCCPPGDEAGLWGETRFATFGWARGPHPWNQTLFSLVGHPLFLLPSPEASQLSSLFVQGFAFPKFTTSHGTSNFLKRMFLLPPCPNHSKVGNTRPYSHPPIFNSEPILTGRPLLLSFSRPRAIPERRKSFPSDLGDL